MNKIFKNETETNELLQSIATAVSLELAKRDIILSQEQWARMPVLVAVFLNKVIK